MKIPIIDDIFSWLDDFGHDAYNKGWLSYLLIALIIMSMVIVWGWFR